VSPNDVGIALITVAIGSAVLALVGRRFSPDRRWPLIPIAIVTMVLLGLLLLFGSSFAAGWFGGPDG
jgi:uncharacterized membrane protein